MMLEAFGFSPTRTLQKSTPLPTGLPAHFGGLEGLPFLKTLYSVIAAC